MNVTTVRAVPAEAKAVEVAEAVIATEKKVANASKVTKRPWLYHGTQKIDAMSTRQLRGALRRTTRTRAHELPRERDEKAKVNKAALVDVALGIALEIVLDSHRHGVPSYLR